MTYKQKLPFALLISFAFSSSFFLFGVLDIYFGNQDEFIFSLADFILPILLVTLSSMGIVFAILILTKGIVFRVFFGLFTWLTVMGYVQSIFLNFGVSSLLGDDSDVSIAPYLVVINTAIWILTLFAFLFFALKAEKNPLVKTVAVIMVIALLGMQISSSLINMVSSADDMTNTTSGTDSDASSYLTTAGLKDVSSGNNIIIFVLDRFDISYYEALVNIDANFFSPLTGFTFFEDNISLYSRTFPAACAMITGVDNDWTQGRVDYFENAYQNSDFLNLLKDNNYRIKIYGDHYYVYEDADALTGIADNVSASGDYSITSYSALAWNMIVLSLYRSVPHILKSTVNVSSAVFSSLVNVHTDDPMYTLNDAEVYRILHEDGLNIDQSQNSYMFLHLSGCHDPYTMDENGQSVENGTSTGAITGCFRMIYDYIDELKEKGLYETSTIVITGDHPRARNDSKVPGEPRITSLFVKPSGTNDEPLAYSSAQVSHENLIPTLLQSVGLSLSGTTASSYFDVSSTADQIRYHKFELYSEGTNYIVTFKITGKGSDFSNWTEVSRQEIGSLYK